MADKPTGVGIVGTGRISDLHAIEYLQNPDSRIVALCDVDPDRAAAKARSWGADGAAVTDDLADILDNPAIDLVEILVPHDHHLDLALKAIAAGKAVSLQKPMCLSPDDADRLVEAAADSPRPFKIFENFLFFPPVARASQLVGQGAIGELLSIRIKSNPGYSETAWDVPAHSESWRQDHAKSGGGPLVFDDGHHKFSLAWHFMGNPVEVHAFIGSTPRPDGFVFDAPALVSFRFPENRIGNLEIVYSPDLQIDTRHYAQDDRVEITGSRGVLWINCGHGRLPGAPPLSLYRDGRMQEFHDIETGWEQSFVLSTRHFIDVVRHGGTPVLTAAEGRQVLRFALAAEQSAATNQPVKLDPQ